MTRDSLQVTLLHAGVRATPERLPEQHWAMGAGGWGVEAAGSTSSPQCHASAWSQLPRLDPPSSRASPVPPPAGRSLRWGFATPELQHTAGSLCALTRMPAFPSDLQEATAVPWPGTHPVGTTSLGVSVIAKVRGMSCKNKYLLPTTIFSRLTPRTPSDTNSSMSEIRESIALSKTGRFLGGTTVGP